MEGHHILYQQWLREAGLKFGLDQESLLWDQRNLLSLCYRHHSRHHNAVERVPMSILPPEVFEMARELFIDWRLERTYMGAK